MNRLKDLEKIAIERFKVFEPEDGYYLAYSGGKDSDVIKILAQLYGTASLRNPTSTNTDGTLTRGCGSLSLRG